MANYILSLDKGKKNFEEILWNKIPDFSNLNNHLLKDIDLFTTSFKNEDDLKEELVKNGLMSLNDYNQKLSIRYKSRGVVKNLGYGLAYSDDKMFLDEIYLAYYLESCLINIQLLEKLCNHYRNSYIQGVNINAIRNYINCVSKGSEMEEEDIKHLHSCLKNFVIREAYYYDVSTSTYKSNKDGSAMLKYKGVHDLGMFFAHDKRKRDKIQLPIPKQEKEEPKVEPIRTKPKDKPKTKVKKKNVPMEGQISLFD